MAWHLHIELSCCFCLQQLFLSVLGAYVRGWVLLWHCGQKGSLPGDGRAKAGLSFLSLLPHKETCGFLCSHALCHTCSCSGHSAEGLLCCGFCFALSRSSVLRSWELTQWGCVWHLLLLLWLVTSCDHQQSVMSSTALLTWPCCAGLGHHGADDLLAITCGKGVWRDCKCVFLLYILLSCWLSCLSFEAKQHPFVQLSGHGDLMYDYLDCGRLLEVWVSRMNCWLWRMCPSQMQEEPNTVSHHAGQLLARHSAE